METLTAEERAILQRSSYVNRLCFPPFIASDAASTPGLTRFSDPAVLDLSPAQREAFSHWGRAPASLPLRAHAPQRIVQGPVQNCSLICTLSLLGYLLPDFPSGTMFPSSLRSRSGRYGVKLWWNGVPRLVVIDDALPMAADGTLLCATSGDLWPALVEKAYCKLLSGGYDFWQGSNSGLDAYVLLGWPPESLEMNDLAVTWTALRRGLARGDNLVTLTSSASLDEKATGLARGHAYAVIDARQVGAHRFLQLRNPWGKGMWRGALSKAADWPDALRAALNWRTTNSADAEDNEGVFWMRLDDVAASFSALHVNWNLELFPYTRQFHVCVPGELDDSRHVGDCFQLLLSIPDTSVLCWVVVVRHVTSKLHILGDDDGDALALHVSPGQSSRVFHLNAARQRGAYNTAPVSTFPIEQVKDDVVLSLARYKPGERALDASVIVYSTHTLNGVAVIPLVLPGGSCSGTGAFAPASQVLANALWLVRYPANAVLRARLRPDDDAAVVGIHVYVASASVRGRCTRRSSERAGFAVLEWQPDDDAKAAGDLVILEAVAAPSRGSYALTVECSLAGLQLVPPTDAKQQSALRRLCL